MLITAFDPSKICVVFVLGGPGAGKGTQCKRIKEDYDYVHLSVGDLLREEQMRAESQFGELIQSYIRDGKIVPTEITVALLESRMRSEIDQGCTRFLVDGFPRQIHQAVFFEETVVESRLTLYFTCSEDILLSRLLKRGKNSGRIDDNIDSIKKRFQTFKDTSYPAIELLLKRGKVCKINAEKSEEEVYQLVKKIFDAL